MFLWTDSLVRLVPMLKSSINIVGRFQFVDHCQQLFNDHDWRISVNNKNPVLDPLGLLAVMVA